MKFYTLGHSTHSREALVQLLQFYGIDCLVDVRSVPQSHTNPQFNKEDLRQYLGEQGIQYRYLGRLGGYRSAKNKDSRNLAWRNPAFKNYADYALTEEFQKGLAELEQLARESIPAIMCAEAVYWRCHRRIIADWLTARDHTVIHIFDPQRAEPHTLTRFAQMEEGIVTYPEEE